MEGFLTGDVNYRLSTGLLRLSHYLLNFWSKLRAKLLIASLDNYAALCNQYK